MLNTSFLEIDKKALASNMKFIRNHLGKNRIVSSVIKGNAYGHGIEQIVELQFENGIRHFSVFSAYEASRTLTALNGRDAVIMIMGDLHLEQIEWAIKNHIQFYVFDITRLQHALSYAKELGIQAKIHLELETGMNRLGIEIHEIEDVSKLLIENEMHLSIEGMCTHFAGAESIANHLRVRAQIKQFERMRKKFHECGVKAKLAHASCSAAALRFPKMRLDMVRIGILQYGFWPNEETYISYLEKYKANDNPLKRVISWKSKVMTIKHVSRGQFVGYGNSYLASRSHTMAVVPVGYSNGFSRSLSNHGRVIIHGVRASVAGIVNMNAITVDVTNVDREVKVGDEVILIGKQGDAEISVSAFGDFSDQLNYEVLARLPNDLERMIV